MVILGLLRTVPIFVSAHTLCQSRKAWFTRNAHADNDIDIINYVIKSGIKMKAVAIVNCCVAKITTTCP